MSDSQYLPTTQRSKLKRLPQRGSQERELIYSILDEGLVAHVGFVSAHQPFVIPMAYGRKGDRLYLHGASVSRLLKTLEQGADVCFTVTILDGLVIARSLFHHSMNYRSVVLFGKAQLVKDPKEKMQALQALTEQMIAGRWQEARLPNNQELQATKVLSFSIQEGSAKVRTGEPKDDLEDYSLSFWAGELPLQLTVGVAIPESKLAAGIPIPQNIARYQRQSS